MVSTEIRIVFLAMAHMKHDPSVTAAEWIELVILRDFLLSLSDVL